MTMIVGHYCRLTGALWRDGRILCAIRLDERKKLVRMVLTLGAEQFRILSGESPQPAQVGQIDPDGRRSKTLAKRQHVKMGGPRKCSSNTFEEPPFTLATCGNPIDSTVVKSRCDKGEAGTLSRRGLPQPAG